jgi:hypothetical protein
MDILFINNISQSKYNLQMCVFAKLLNSLQKREVYVNDI